MDKDSLLTWKDNAIWIGKVAAKSLAVSLVAVASIVLARTIAGVLNPPPKIDADAYYCACRCGMRYTYREFKEIKNGSNGHPCNA
jgi:hypothetical protein